MDNITTLGGVIAEVDALEPNSWGYDEKVRCISRLDGQLWDKHCKGRNGAPERRPVYGPDAPEDTALLCQHPYDGIYAYWLMAHIALYLGENDRYNDLMAKCEEAKAEWADSYAAEHPKTGGTRFLF